MDLKGKGGGADPVMHIRDLKTTDLVTRCGQSLTSALKLVVFTNFVGTWRRAPRPCHKCAPPGFEFTAPPKTARERKPPSAKIARKEIAARQEKGKDLRAIAHKPKKPRGWSASA
jgi:hypothetical protein